ncbi:hypothetical protein AVEN_185793-1 [Araneus ventricosus]|uniref:Retroviral polymerase SH3-like domain-containing protein n=1 Tax=Araneus ventricosus TaxID=182803 RepID=A0A4Y2HIE8_ARAVE|nr:hypothetical protein AVEN_185793-1 [Araneus ventricosus]
MCLACIQGKMRRQSFPKFASTRSEKILEIAHSDVSKLDLKAKECVLVGYPEGVKGYKLWDMKKKNFFTSRDVIFEENILPFKEERHLSQSEEEMLCFILRTNK